MVAVSPSLAPQLVGLVDDRLIVPPAWSRAARRFTAGAAALFIWWYSLHAGPECITLRIRRVNWWRVITFVQLPRLQVFTGKLPVNYRANLHGAAVSLCVAKRTGAGFLPKCQQYLLTRWAVSVPSGVDGRPITGACHASSPQVSFGGSPVAASGASRRGKRRRFTSLSIPPSTHQARRPSGPLRSVPARRPPSL